jgi:hypothetical protein
MPLGLVLEGGLAGGLLFVVVVALALKPLVRPRIRDPIATLGMTYGAFFLLYGAVAINFRLFPEALFYWMIIGFALGIVCARQKPPHRAEGMSAWPS